MARAVDLNSVGVAALGSVRCIGAPVRVVEKRILFRCQSGLWLRLRRRRPRASGWRQAPPDRPMRPSANDLARVRPDSRPDTATGGSMRQPDPVPWRRSYATPDP